MPRRKREPTPTCPWCGSPADRACDGPLAVPEGADRSDPAKTTCSAPVCSRCSTHVQPARPFSAIVCSRGRGGRGCEVIDNRGDLCPFCAGRQGQDLLGRETHDKLLAQAIAAAVAERDFKPDNQSESAKKYRTDENVTRPAKPLTGPQPGDRLWLIDADGWVHRLYHAIPLEFAPASPAEPSAYEPAIPVNALVGFLRTLRKLRERLDPKPRWLLPVFDWAPDGGWRAKLYPGYKADRPPKPPELREQLPLIRALLDAMGIAYTRVEGVEADDLIASYTEAAVARGLEVVIVANDKDLLQLLRGSGGPGSVLGLSAFGELELRGPEYVREKFGVGPERLGDLLALAGDKVDGIPGAPGVGPKTAAKLLMEPEPRDLAAVLDRWSFGTSRKIGAALRDHAEKIRLSRELVSLRREPLPFGLEDIRPWAPTKRALDGFFRELGYPRFEAALDRYEE